MFKITFIDSVKKSKQIWNIEEAERTYVFGRSCLSFFTARGIAENECYVDIFSDTDTVISKDQLYVTLSVKNILEIKFKNKLRTFFADQEYSKIDNQKYEYYYIKANKGERLKFKADTNKYIIRIEYDMNLKQSEKLNENDARKIDRRNKNQNHNSIAKRNFSIESLVNDELKFEKLENGKSSLKEEILSEAESDGVIEASLQKKFPEQLSIPAVISNDVKIEIESNDNQIAKDTPIFKEKKKPGRKPNQTTVKALAKKEQQKATVNNLMHTLYEAQKKNHTIQETNKENNYKEDSIREIRSNSFKIKEFTLKTVIKDPKLTTNDNDAENSSINYKRFKKRRFGEIESYMNNTDEAPIKKIPMKKYIDNSIPRFKTMKDLEVDTRHMSKKTVEKLKQNNTLTISRNKTTETKHLFLDD
ncbi:hypothetical protein DAHU10_028440 [Hanseniaspora uvarum]|nr:hypothetical protein DAHU10_028440 [Hanseniaspora uvarum]